MCGGFSTFLLFADAGAGHKSLPMVQYSLHAGTTFPGAPLLSRRFGAMHLRNHSLPQSLYRTSLRFQSPVRTCAMGQPDNLFALGSNSCESGFQVAAPLRPWPQDIQPLALRQTAAIQQRLKNRVMTFATLWESSAPQSTVQVKMQSQLDILERRRLRAAFVTWRHAASDRDDVAAEGALQDRLTSVERQLAVLTKLMQQLALPQGAASGIATQLAGQTASSSAPPHPAEDLKAGGLIAATATSTLCSHPLSDLKDAHLAPVVSPQPVAEDGQQVPVIGSLSTDQDSKQQPGLVPSSSASDTGADDGHHQISSPTLPSGTDRVKLMFYQKVREGADMVGLLCRSPGPLASSYQGYRGIYLSCLPHRRQSWESDLLLPVMPQQQDVKTLLVTDWSIVVALDSSQRSHVCISPDMLQAYCQEANLEAATVLPCVLDAGTNDYQLQKGYPYAGCKSARLQGSTLQQLQKDVRETAEATWPGVRVVFEDFGMLPTPARPGSDPTTVPKTVVPSTRDHFSSGLPGTFDFDSCMPWKQCPDGLDMLAGPDGCLPAPLRRLEEKHLRDVCSRILPGGGSTSWDDIVGQEEVKRLLEQLVIWPTIAPHMFRGRRSPAKGLLLFGPPGTGKTLIGRCIASQVKATFFSISSADLMSKWLGDGEKLVRTLFELATHMQPSVIFIDEIDAIMSVRKADGEHEASRRLKTQLLVQMEGCDPAAAHRKVLVVGATNRPEELDEAARRRLPKQVYVALPDAAARRSMLVKQLGQDEDIKVQLSEAEWDEAVERTQGYSGSDISHVITDACYRPLDEGMRMLATPELQAGITDEHVRPVVWHDLELALQRQKPSVKQEELVRYLEHNKAHGMSIK